MPAKEVGENIPHNTCYGYGSRTDAGDGVFHPRA